MRRVQVSTIVLIVCVISVSTYSQYSPVNAVTPIANIVLEIFDNGKDVLPEYGFMIAEKLEALGIDVEVKIIPQSWFYSPVGVLCGCHDYDMMLVEVDFSLNDPDPTKFFHSETLYNYPLFDIDLPYGNQSEILLEEALSITNVTERKQKYLEWSNLVMDKIVSVYPLFNPKSGSAAWPNLKGFDIRWGLSESLPQMYYDGFHSNQSSSSEINLAHDSIWRNLFSLFHMEEEDSEILSLLSDQLLYFGNLDYDIKGGLIESWDKQNETHYTFNIRDNIYWNPSLNISERTFDSIPFVNVPEIDLMRGLKNDEFSNGTNQQFTAKDVVFTLLSLSNPIGSINSIEYNWIKDVKINETNNLSFEMIVDSNPNTPEQEPYIPMWSKLAIPCLPEFFLNSSDMAISYSDGGIPMVGLYSGIEETIQWQEYSDSSFGCGKYMLDYTELGNITVLQASPYWHGIEYIYNTEQSLNFTTININVIPEFEHIVDSFQEGYLDIYFYDDIAPHAPFEPYFDYQTILSGRTTCLIFNLRRPFIGGADNFAYLDYVGKEDYTKGIAVRKALCYAIDKEKINSAIHENEHRLARGLVHDIWLQPFSSEVFYYNYNLSASYEWLGPAASYPIPTTPTQTTPTTNIISFHLSWMFSIILYLVLREIKNNRRKKKL